MGVGREISLSPGNHFEETAMGRALLALSIPLFRLAVTYFCFPRPILALVKLGCRWQAGVARKKIRIGDHNWVYLDGGQGDPLVFIHGFGADKDRYGTLLPKFSTSYRVIAPDLPGFGESDYIASKHYGFLKQTRRLKAFLDALNLDRVTLVSMSMGGAICGCFAAEYPDRVKRLVLMNTIGLHAPVLSDAWQLYRNRAINIFLYDSMSGFDQMMAHLFVSPPPIPRHFKTHFVRESVNTAPVHQKLMADMIAEGMEPLESRMGRIQAKTLLIWGEADRITHVSGAERLQAGIRNCRVEILSDCGHVPFIEKPEETCRAISRFLKTQGTT